MSQPKLPRGAAGQLAKELRKLGYSVTVQPKGRHLRVETPTGPYFMSLTPSDWRFERKVRSDLRRMGVEC